MSELAVESLSDVLDSENGNKSEIISQCYALRASIGMAGHGAFKLDNMSYQGDKDIVYWHDKYNNVWTTDNRYFEAPSFATEYDTIANFIKTYPHGWKNHHGDTVTENKKNWAILLGSPAEARMEGEMFRRTLEEYIIKKGKHNDGYTDLAYVTLKATDSTGHHFGWESLESRETFTETDKQVGLIFEMLKKNYGDKFIMIITADHGCAPLPEISGGKRLTIDKFFEEIHSLLPEGNTDSLINYATIGQISLNKEMLKKHNISEEEVRNKIKMISVDGKPFFKEVILKSELNTK